MIECESSLWEIRIEQQQDFVQTEKCKMIGAQVPHLLPALDSRSPSSKNLQSFDKYRIETSCAAVIADNSAMALYCYNSTHRLQYI